jgi:hypothetical protein
MQCLVSVEPKEARYVPQDFTNLADLQSGCCTSFVIVAIFPHPRGALPPPVPIREAFRTSFSGLACILLETGCHGNRGHDKRSILLLVVQPCSEYQSLMIEPH